MSLGNAHSMMQPGAVTSISKSAQRAQRVARAYGARAYMHVECVLGAIGAVATIGSAFIEAAPTLAAHVAHETAYQARRKSLKTSGGALPRDESTTQRVVVRDALRVVGSPGQCRSHPPSVPAIWAKLSSLSSIQEAISSIKNNPKRITTQAPRGPQAGSNPSVSSLSMVACGNVGSHHHWKLPG